MTQKTIEMFSNILTSIMSTEAEYWSYISPDGKRISAYDLEMYPADEMIKLPGVGYVHNTQTGYYEQCVHCGKYFLIDGGTGMFEMTDGRFICTDCFYQNSRYKRCYDCERIIDTYTARYRNGETGNYYCDECVDNYNVCGRCGRVLDLDEEYYEDPDDGLLCENCADEARSDIIHGYEHTRPDVFYKMSDEPETERYFGIELEIGGGGDRNYKVAQKVVDNIDGLVECKYDGSISNGFEIVTMPMTFKKHLSFMDEWADFMDYAKDNGFESNEDVNCGLHVHVSRKALGSNRDKRNDNIDKILYIFEGFWDEVESFSRRSQDQIADWCKRYLTEREKVTKKKIKDKKDNGDRYMAVNLTNNPTVEFRIFNGTLNVEEFYAALEFVNRIVDIVTTKTEDEVMEMTWEDIITGDDSMKELVSYGTRRMIDGTTCLKDKFEEESENFRVSPVTPWEYLPVGTRVRVGNIRNGEEYNTWCVISNMEQTSGAWATICEIEYGPDPMNVGYQLDFDNASYNNGLYYSIGMFSDFRLPTGTTVMVRDDLEPRKCYGGLYFARDMIGYRGTMAGIETVAGDRYWLNTCDDYVFNNWMFEETLPFAMVLQHGE